MKLLPTSQGCFAYQSLACWGVHWGGAACSEVGETKRSRRRMERNDARKDDAETLRRQKGAEESGIFFELGCIFLELGCSISFEKKICADCRMLWRS